jgi:hypothetical protein
LEYERLQIEPGTTWKAADGRLMRVLEKSGRFVVCEVLNATGRMRKKTQLDESNFGDFLMPYRST